MRSTASSSAKNPGDPSQLRVTRRSARSTQGKSSAANARASLSLSKGKTYGGGTCQTKAPGAVFARPSQRVFGIARPSSVAAPSP